MKAKATKVAVLMAVKNGLPYLPEQISSILKQVQCHVHLFVSDDFSTDGSTEYLQKISAEHQNISLLPNPLNHGSAAKNFFSLINKVDTNAYDYFAFADQDDIWFPDKLIQHIKLALQHNADGISSNVIAFWSDGRECLLDKSQPQRELDYLFESAGPGCTYLITPRLIAKLQAQLQDNGSPSNEVAFHDWLAYAVCRAYKYNWVIASEPSLKYRQHQSNTYGANIGLTAKWARLQQLKTSWYRDEIIKISKVCYKISADPSIGTLINVLEDKGLIARLYLLNYITKSRRKSLDRLLLAGAILAGLL
jgi:rhamnosyltransferase